MRRKGLFLFLCFTIMVFSFCLGVWTSWAEAGAHYVPEYARVDILPILQKEGLTEKDYEALLEQTGMAQAGVDALRAEKREHELFYLQKRFFGEVEVECLRSNFIVQSERLIENAAYDIQSVDARSNAVLLKGDVEPRAELSGSFLPAIQDGDILISFSGHVFGWRYGHAAIVVDAQRGLTVEAINLGSDSKLRSVEHWREYPTFALLRVVQATPEQRQAAAAYAESNLVGVPYSLFSFGGEAGAFLPGTQCAHLVWHAYAYAGYNLDSDGGVIVTPRDIYDSEMVEVVQLYGVEPE